MLKTKILQRLWLLLLVMTAGVEDAWALYTNISFANQNRISNNGEGVFTSANNAANAYALAIADMSGLNGINTVGLMSISFEVNFSQGTRWQIGIGDKRIRGTNANGSLSSSYSTTGLMMHICDDGGLYYRVKINGNNQYGTNNSSAYNEAYGRRVRVNLLFNRENHTFQYSLTDVVNSKVYFTGSNISTTVDSPSIIEAYTWTNNSQITLSNVTVNYNFFFDKTDETVFIEDIVYNNPFNNAENKTNVAFAVSNATYLREDHVNNNYYPIKTTGSVSTNSTEGDPITVTATADDTEPTRFRLRIKTRNELDPSTMYTSLTNTFDVGTTLGMCTSQVINMDGMTLYLGYLGHTPVIRSINGDYGITIIDTNGWTFGNYAEGHEWGTVYKIATTQAKNLTVTGYFAATSSNALQLHNSTGQAIAGKSLANPGNGSLVTATFALDANQTYLLYVPYSIFALKSLSYRDAYFDQTYAITTTGSTYTQTVQNMESPVYSIVGREGDIASTGVTINSSTGQVSGITAGGALKIQATGGGKTCFYYLTVAYPATPYPGKLWEFNQWYDTYQPPLSIDEAGKLGFPRIDANSDGSVVMTDGDPSTITDEHGDEWVAELKNINYGAGRDARWRHANAVQGDNAFIVSETAGLVFNTGGKGFFVRNDRTKYNCWGHVGIRRSGASFTIPQLAAGDIVEINWKRESGGAGGEYTATNVTDLRNKPVNEQFEITGSQNGTTGGALDIYKNPGYTSFIATGGDVTFTLQDGGATDILSIRIYSGGYRSTMRPISDNAHHSPQTSMLLDNSYDEYEYDYCNVLNSTNTGPAIYVLKGYRRGEDNVECVSGTNSGLSPTPFSDNDATYPAYPVTSAESTKLYNLRKNLVGFRMYNRTWQSTRNSYNNGKVGATSGWGKVTIRMNNYTNDMKYVIGYTNDVTMTFGSAPHQTYPYTWDFTHISAQNERGAATNVYNSIEGHDLYDNNWTNTENGVYSLNTKNSGQDDSHYTPGAVLVTTDRSLSKIEGVSGTSYYAKDELDGLGFNGKISIDTDQKPSASPRYRRAGSTTVDLLSFTMDDYKIVKTTEVVDGETIVTDWRNAVNTDLAAGMGWVNFGADRIVESSVAACGFAYKCDYNAPDDKCIYLRPARKLKNGDVISVKVYATSTPNGSDYGISIYPSSGSTAAATIYIGAGLKNVETTLSYTITAGDGLNDQSMIRLFRTIDKSVYLSEVLITGDATAEAVSREIFCEAPTTITVPDLNADSKQDWIYVSASAAPTEVTNATLVSSGTDGPDANDDHDVYKYKVTATGDAKLTFGMGTRIRKIGVTHILKEIHPVGGTGWATEIRNHSIDHELTGYFTKNDVNAYTVSFDSYDLTTATVALTPINEDGYVPQKTGMVLRLDNIGELEDANNGKNVPLFYPSYTKAVTSTAVDFPDNNLMYNVDAGIDNNNRNYNEVFYNPVGNGINYTKFVLTNVHWKYTVTDDNGVWAAQDNATAAGFYRLHIWGDDRDIMAANTAFLCVPTDQLPIALWSSYPSSSSPQYTIGIRETDDLTGIAQGELTAPAPTDGWYTLSGMKLADKPKKAGLYIHNGRKILLSPYDF